MLCVCFGTSHEEWIFAYEVCAHLGLTNASKAIRTLWADHKREAIIQARDAPHMTEKFNVDVLSEPGLYQLIFKSRTDFAKNFQKWVFTEVLPQIRRTGSDQAPAEFKAQLDHLTNGSSWTVKKASKFK